MGGVVSRLRPARGVRSCDRAGTRDGPASVAKGNVIDVVRDLGLGDEAFGRVVGPVLREFTGSTAKGGWQACRAALVRLRGAHPTIELASNHSL